MWPLGGAPEDPGARAEAFFLSYLVRRRPLRPPSGRIWPPSSRADFISDLLLLLQAAPVFLAFWLGCFLIKRTTPFKAHEIDLDVRPSSSLASSSRGSYSRATYSCAKS